MSNGMKYFLLLGDGMADYPIPQLGNITPLEAACKPVMDKLASDGEVGLVKTVPDHLNPPGSDIANMSVMGYDPDIYYTGRSPLEAVSMGIHMKESDLALRCNLVTLSDEADYKDTTMVDYSSDEISTEESKELILYINEKLGTEIESFYPGISYRHCLIMDFPGIPDLKLTPPHDISGQPVANYLPKGKEGERCLELMMASRKLLADHPINKARIQKGLNPATSIWLWGEGRKPGLGNFYEKYGLKGGVMSAVDLVKGLGKCADMELLSAENLTGNIKTNFEGKAVAAIDFLKNGGDFVYLHVEAPDECGHRGELENKVKSIEFLDSRILDYVVTELGKMGDYRIMILPDHPTPISLKTHTHDPVPYLIYDSRQKLGNNSFYSEQVAKESGIYIEKGYTLMDRFLEKA